MEMLPSLSPASQRRFKRSVRIIDAFVTTGKFRSMPNVLPFRSFLTGFGQLHKISLITNYPSDVCCRRLTIIDGYYPISYCL